MKLNNNLYGISGGIKGGKDMVGQIIRYLADSDEPTFEDFERTPILQSRYEIRKFADKLKDIVCLILGCTRKQLEDREFKEKALSEEWDKWVIINTYLNNQVGDIWDNGFYVSKEAAIEEERKLRNAYIWDETLKSKIERVQMTPRIILQLLGTECGREIIHPNIWVNALFADYKPNPYEVSCNLCGKTSVDKESKVSCTSCLPNWVITDVRFQNEVDAVKSRNGLMLGVKRRFSLRFPEHSELELPNDPYIIPPKLSEVDNELYSILTHASESKMGGLEWCDLTIKNDGTMEELFNELRDILVI